MAYYSSSDQLEPEQCVTIPSIRSQENFTEYVIQVVIKGLSWTVYRRYSEFDELNQRLVADYSIDKKVLPPKKLIGNTNDNFIHKRRLALEKYLQYLLQQFRLLPYQLALFLDFQKYEICGITHALAELLYTRGESILDRGAVCSMDPLQIMSIGGRMVKTQSIETVSPRNDMGHILDFTARLQALRIIGTEELVGTSNINMNELSFSMSIFKSLTRLEVFKCNLYKINSLDLIQSSLTKLKLKKTLSSNAKSFEVLTRSSSSAWETEDDEENLSGSNRWPTLTWLDMSENQLTTLPQSLCCMSRLEYLDVHDNYLENLDHLQELSYLSHLDVSLNRIKHLSDLHIRLGNVRTINLRGNKLDTLTAFSKLYSLEYLDVSNNVLSQIKEVEPLGSLPLLENLVVTGNPLTVVPDYRIQILCMFGDRANQVNLDNNKASDKELDTVAVLKALEHSKNTTTCHTAQSSATQSTIYSENPTSGSTIHSESENATSCSTSDTELEMPSTCPADHTETAISTTGSTPHTKPENQTTCSTGSIEPENPITSQSEPENSTSSHTLQSELADPSSNHTPHSKPQDPSSNHTPHSEPQDATTRHMSQLEPENTTTCQTPESEAENTTSCHTPQSEPETATTCLTPQSAPENTTTCHTPQSAPETATTCHMPKLEPDSLTTCSVSPSQSDTESPAVCSTTDSESESESAAYSTPNSYSDSVP